MLQIISNAYEVVRTTLGKIKEGSRPVRKFVFHVLPLWLAMNCRYVFMNLERWGGRREKSYRRMFARTFDWFAFNCELVKRCFKGKVIGIFDPSFIPKSGKKTYGLSKFYSGTAGRALKGLEIGCLCFAGVKEHTALHGICVQSPTPQSLHTKGQTLLDHYAAILVERITAILAMTSYLVVDGYFLKKGFIGAMLAHGLQVVTKARSDANLRYVYKGKQKQRGRKRICDGKVDVSRVDGRRIPLLASNQEKDVYAGVVYSVVLKRMVLAVFVYSKDPKTGHYIKNKKTKKAKPEILIATDTEMSAETVCRYYDLRFQVEFLLRDSKSYAGLEDCQARTEEKLHSHFNIAMTAVSVAKAAYHLSLPKKQQAEGFSMQDVKMLHMNELITNRIFYNLDIDPSCEKYKQAYENSINFGRLRA